MAVGDKVTGLQAVTSFQTLRIQPPVGVEWTIHNIYHEKKAALEVVTGTSTLRIDVDAGFGGWLGYWFNVTSAQSLQVRNLTSTSQLIGFDGVVTK